MNHRDQIHDQWLVMRCQEADAGALDEILTRWQERLFRHAVRLTGDSDAAWDILQETMFVISRRISQLTDPAAFPAWAYRIATNQCHDFFRRNQRHHRSIKAYFDRQPLEKQRDPGSAMDLQAALGQLSGPQQTILSLRYEEGFSVSEIAGILGIHVGTVKSRLFAARQQLRSLLEEHNE